VRSSRTSVTGSSRASIISVDICDDEKYSRTSFAGASRGSDRLGNTFDAEKNTHKLTSIPVKNSSTQELDTHIADSQESNRLSRRKPLKESSSSLNSLLLYLGLTLLVAFAGLILRGLFTSNTEMIIPMSTPATPFPDEALLAAAAAGSWENTSRLLKEGAKPSIRDSKLRTPLHLAAANGSTDTIKLLLEQKDTGWFADDDVTPLHLAARYGHIAAVKQITEISGHDWNRERATAPQAIRKLKAAMGSRFNQQFANFFARKTFTARELAVIYGHVDTALSFPSGKNDDIRHALSCACMLGDVHMVEEIRNHHKNRRYFQRHWSLESRVRWFPLPRRCTWLSCLGTVQRSPSSSKEVGK
jgi:ankyrin repeat protein